MGSPAEPVRYCFPIVGTKHLQLEPICFVLNVIFKTNHSSPHIALLFTPGQEQKTLLNQAQARHHRSSCTRVENRLRWVPTPPSTASAQDMVADRSVVAPASLIRASMSVRRR